MKETKIFDSKQAACNILQAETMSIGRTCIICDKTFPISQGEFSKPICPHCLEKIRKVIGVEK